MIYVISRQQIVVSRAAPGLRVMSPDEAEIPQRFTGAWLIDQ